MTMTLGDIRRHFNRCGPSLDPHEAVVTKALLGFPNANGDTEKALVLRINQMTRLLDEKKTELRALRKKLDALNT